MKHKEHVFTLGIEEEFQIIDPETRALSAQCPEIMASGEETLEDQVKPELHQSMVELRTEVCQDIGEARAQILELRAKLAQVAAGAGVRIASAGTHPFSKWSEQQITPNERYDTIVREMQQTARSNVIFGLHVHVGIPSREIGLALMNQVRTFLPHLFALSVNSPFWQGENTGLQGYRPVVFEAFPRTGIPEIFENLAAYEDYIDLLVSTDCIDNAKKIWWDVRLHPFFDTLEFRGCDAQSRVDDTIALAALLQALIMKLHRQHEKGVAFSSHPRRLLDENHWRAARYGLNGKLIDFERREEVETRTAIEKLLAFVDEEVEELGSRPEIEHIEKIMAEGTGAERQLASWKRSGDLKTVVDQILAETTEKLPPAGS